jgi:hypothetical protein
MHIPSQGMTRNPGAHLGMGWRYLLFIWYLEFARGISYILSISVVHRLTSNPGGT